MIVITIFILSCSLSADDILGSTTIFCETKDNVPIYVTVDFRFSLRDSNEGSAGNEALQSLKTFHGKNYKNILAGEIEIYVFEKIYTLNLSEYSAIVKSKKAMEDFFSELVSNVKTEHERIIIESKDFWMQYDPL